TLPRSVPRNRDGVEVVHPGAAEGAVGDGETGRLDDIGLDAEAGAEAQNRSGVLRNVGLIEGDTHAEHSGPAGGWPSICKPFPAAARAGRPPRRALGAPSDGTLALSR